MKRKKLISKILASVLSIVTLVSTLPARAEYDPFNNAWLEIHDVGTWDDPSQWELWLEKELGDFYQLFRENGEVTDEVIDKIHPLCLVIWLSSINYFFYNHPQIKDDFISMIRAKGGDKFVLDVTSENTDGNTLAYFARTYNNTININPEYYGKHRMFSEIVDIQKEVAQSREFLIPIDPNNYVGFIANTAYHELGHLIEETYIFKHFKKKYPHIADDMCRTVSATASARRLRGVDLTERYWLSEPSEYDDWLRIPNIRNFLTTIPGYEEIFERMLTEIREHIWTKSLLGNREIRKKISTYAMTSPAEWFAEAFAQTMVLMGEQPELLSDTYDADEWGGIALYGNVNRLIDNWETYLPEVCAVRRWRY